MEEDEEEEKDEEKEEEEKKEEKGEEDKDAPKQLPTPSSRSSPCPLCFTICVSSFHFPSALMGRASEWAGGVARSVKNTA